MDPLTVVVNALKMVSRVIHVRESWIDGVNICNELLADIAVLESPLLELKKSSPETLTAKSDLLIRLYKALRESYRFIKPIIMDENHNPSTRYHEAFADMEGLAAKLVQFSGRLRNLMPGLLLAVSFENSRRVVCTIDNVQQMLRDQLSYSSGFEASCIPDELYVPEPQPLDEDADEHVLSRGFFGTVQRARNTADGNMYAVKRIDLEQCSVDGVSNKALEARVAALQDLRHANIARCFLCYSSAREWDLCLVMELPAGYQGSLSLADAIGHEAPSGPLLRRWLTEMLSALLYLHSDANVQHRALAPWNVLLTADGAIKLSEFGLAVRSRTGPEIIRASAETGAYFSPERCGGESYDGRDDVWAAGCIVLDLLSGRPLQQALCHGGDCEQTRARDELVEECRCRCSADLFPIVERMVLTRLRERARSCEAFRQLIVSGFLIDGPAVPAPLPVPFIPDGDGISELFVGARYCGDRAAWAELRRLVGLRVQVAEGFWAVLLHEGRLRTDALLHLPDEFTRGGSAPVLDPAELWAALEEGEDLRTEPGYRRLLMGKFCELGMVRPVDPVAAVQHYKRAAYEGAPDAQYSLGRCYASGLGVRPDPVTAAKYFRIAANQQHAQAMHALGQALLDGVGVSRDDAAAFQWLEQAARRGHLDALYRAGCCLGSGVGARWDSGLALQYQREAADKGHLDAQYYLGVCLEQGVGVAPDPQAAAQLWELAAAQGNRLAADALVRCRREGVGMERVEAERPAPSLLALAAASRPPSVTPSVLAPVAVSVSGGSPGARLSSPGLSEPSAATMSDASSDSVFAHAPQVAAAWLPASPSPVTDASGRSSAKSSPVRTGSRGAPSPPADPRVHRSDSPADLLPEGQERQAFELFCRAADQGDATSMFAAAQCLRLGCGTARDGHEAVRRYSQALAAGFVEARYMLACCLHDGVGGPQQHAAAFALFQTSADEDANAEAQHMVARYLLEGLGGRRRDPVEAVRYARRGADGGSALAMGLLGLCFWRGSGVAKNLEEAARYARYAADLGDTFSQVLLGRICEERGRPGDAQEALKWYHLAADEGSTDALIELGECYERGLLGLGLDYAKAADYFLTAGELGSGRAEKCLARIRPKLVKDDASSR